MAQIRKTRKEAVGIGLGAADLATINSSTEAPRGPLTAQQSTLNGN
jgi:hypothetical protein